ncbi:hypothetical protein TWF730_004348 [Orbilia blumenaviensis]|uniref:Uncharacterized protein n=1 Tax=Orbilia blumenaviensis TaxID=1796055 RepID=A0AAV9TZN5_9PEZI
MYGDESQQSQHRVFKIMKSRIGAAWFCFANFTSFVFILLVFLGNIYPSSTIFAMISIDLHPQFNNTISFEIYRADNYTGTNPVTNRIEEPRYLYLGFSGHCNIYDNNSTDFNEYSKECTKSFPQPLILPGGTLQNGNGDIRDVSTHHVNFGQVYQMWETTAAFLALTMIYNVASIVAVCAGKYELAFRYFWIMAIFLSVPPAVLALVALSRVYSPLNGAQLPRWGVSFSKSGAGQCLGLGFFLLAMLLTFVAHPIMLAGVIVVVGSGIFILYVIGRIRCSTPESRTSEEERQERREREKIGYWRQVRWEEAERRKRRNRY